jgi:hypothetical protein
MLTEVSIRASAKIATAAVASARIVRISFRHSKMLRSATPRISAERNFEIAEAISCSRSRRSTRVLAATVRVTALQRRRLVCGSRAAIIWQKIKRPRNARGRVTQMALRRTGTPAFFPVSARTPRSPTVSPEHRVEFRAGPC